MESDFLNLDALDGSPVGMEKLLRCYGALYWRSHWIAQPTGDVKCDQDDDHTGDQGNQPVCAQPYAQQLFFLSPIHEGYIIKLIYPQSLVIFSCACCALFLGFHLWLPHWSPLQNYLLE